MFWKPFSGRLPGTWVMITDCQAMNMINQLTLPRCCSVAVGHHGDDGGAGVPPLEVLEAGLDHARRLVLSHHAVSAILEEKAIFESRKTRT